MENMKCGEVESVEEWQKFSNIVMEYIIDFYINGLCTENLLRSQRTPAPYKLKNKNCLNK